MTKALFPVTNIRLKRAHEPATVDDGPRILVDWLWPRGVGKEEAHLNDWMKGIAPSTELRQWFGHEPERWPEFQRRYQAELESHERELDQIRALAHRGIVTLVYSARDEQYNDVTVLREVLLGES